MKIDRSKIRKALNKNKEEEDKKKGGFVDERIWKPEIPKKDKNVYRIRVLPFGNEVPYVKLLQHQIKTKDGFWYENCPSTIDKECPVCDRAYDLFQTNDDVDEKEARKLYKKKVYFANIMVVKDPRNDGENEGKVFLYKFGQKIYNKFESALFPNEDEGEEEVFFIDIEEGYDFILTAKTVAGFANYDESKFAQKSTAIAKSDKKIEAVLDNAYDIEAEIAEDKFKSFDEMEDLFNKKVLGLGGKSGSSKKRVEEASSGVDDNDDFDDGDIDDDTSTDDDSVDNSSDDIDNDDDLLLDLDDFGDDD